MPYYRAKIHPKGYVNRWLVLGPFPILLASGEAPDPHVHRVAKLGALGARTHPIPTDQRGRLRLGTPLPGDEVAFGGVAARWEPYDGGFDHTVLLSERLAPAYNSVAYLFAQVECVEPAALLRLRAERGAEVWVNGEPCAMLFGDASKIGAPDADARFHLNLSPGRHDIAVKLWQCRTVGMNGWGLQFQLLDAAGLPVDKADVLLPVRDEAQACALARQAEAERASVLPDVLLGGRVRIVAPEELGAARAKVSLPGRGEAWEGALADGFGPVPSDLADSVAEAEIEFQDAKGKPLAKIRRDFAVPPSGPPPADARRAVLEAIAAKSPPEHKFSPAGLVARYALGRPPEDPAAWARAGLEFVDERFDCADFNMLRFLRWKHLFGQSPAAEALAVEVDKRILNFVYEEQDSDDHTMCMGTENHRAVFWSCEILAGEMFPAAHFAVTGQTGAWHAARAKGNLLDWMGEKLRFGYGEWGCHYLMVDLDLLCCLRDFCQDAEVAATADALACKTVLLLVNDAWQGAQSGSRSRSYAPENLWPNVRRSASDVFALLGDPFARPSGDSWALGMATTPKPFPAKLARGLNPPGGTLIRERQGREFRAACRTMFRTPRAALASAVCDPRSGNSQTLHWCASLPGEVKIFTTHPGPGNESREHRPNYWSGTVAHPRVGQSRSALLCLYRLRPDDAWGYSHAFWPEARFDETLAADGWLFGRAGDGFVALRPLPGGRTVREGRYANREVLAEGGLNGWICQIGGGGEPFADFVRSLRAAAVQFGEGGVAFQSPKEGRLELRPDGAFLIEGRKQEWEAELHMDSPWAKWRWGADEGEW